MLVTLAVPLAFMRARIMPSTQRKFVELAAWREAPYALFGIAEFLGFMGLYIPFFYVQIYALERAIVDEDLGFYLLALLNAGSFFGRIVSAHVAITMEYMLSSNKSYPTT